MWPSWESPFVGFIAGVLTSLHCLGMCGPLIIHASGINPNTSASRWPLILSYHGARLFSYVAISAVCGFFGQKIISTLPKWPWQIAATSFALIFVALAFGWDKYLPHPAWTRRLHQRLIQNSFSKTRIYSMAILGICTPLLPCGPLYLIFGAALLTGSVLKSVWLAFSFALGTGLPMIIAQTQASRFLPLLKPSALVLFTRGAALSSAILILWRIGWWWKASPVASSCPLCR